MLLMTALLQSENGIATRRKSVNASHGKMKFEYHTAVVCNGGIVHIFNGRNGTIRRAEGADNLLTDWEPFQPSPMPKRQRIKMPKMSAL